MNPNPLAHLAHRPLALLPSAVQAFALRFTEALQPDASRMVAQRTHGTPYRTDGDTAIVSVINPLVTREGQGWGTTSYEFLSYALEAAARDTTAANYRESGLVLWRKAALREGTF